MEYYKIAESCSLDIERAIELLEGKVKTLCNEGWQPYGDICISEGTKFCTMLQPMVPCNEKKEYSIAKACKFTMEDAIKELEKQVTELRKEEWQLHGNLVIRDKSNAFHTMLQAMIK